MNANQVDDPEFRHETEEFLRRHALFLAEARGGGILGTDLETSRRWQRMKAEAGFAGILLPKAVGGRGGTVLQQVIFDQAESEAGAPSDVHFMIGLAICAPAIMRFGTPEQIERQMSPLIRGDEIWCQLFSEPSGGSDVAAARTRARRDGDDWVIDGQKIWTSGAQHSDFGLLLARTDGSVAKHVGLSIFIIDMEAPGVEVRPIRQISGQSHFNEVFLSNVRVPNGQMLGEPGDGWRIVVSMLMSERLAVGRVFTPDVGNVIRLAQHQMLDGKPAIRSGMIRERLARWYCEQQGIKHTVARVTSAIARGEAPGPEASIIKIVDAGREYEMASLAMDLLGPAGHVPEGASGFDAITAFLEAPGTRIGGGTEEILFNVIAERVLGLPVDTRVDKDTPFDSLR